MTIRIATETNYYITIDEIYKERIDLLFCNITNLRAAKVYTVLVFYNIDNQYVRTVSTIEEHILEKLIFHNIVYSDNQVAVLTNNILLRLID